jgi:hypothetical protein
LNGDGWGVVGSAVAVFVPYVGDLPKLLELPKYVSTVAKIARRARDNAEFAAKIGPEMAKLNTAVTKILNDPGILKNLPDEVVDSLRKLQSQTDEFANQVTKSGKQVREILSDLPGKTGKTGPIKEVPTQEALDELFENLSKGGKTVDSGSYPGITKQLPDGTLVRRRPESTSGGATLDVTTPDGTTTKVHINPGDS